ncbi:MAG: hypothetical protein HOP29_11330 [Phycisphaerales bacterium]|nr:hypothetical protein [Phycisphaerales bacterium]
MSGETFYNPVSGETLKHSERADGTRDLFVWRGETTNRSDDHQHSVLNPEGSVRFIRDFDRRVIADDSA